MTALRVLAGLAGAVLVLSTLLAAVRTVVVPRAESVLSTRLVFAWSRGLFNKIARLRPDYEWTDRVMGLYAPLTLVILPLVWLLEVFAGFALLFWAFGEGTIGESFESSGSSLLTLGFQHPATGVGVGLAFAGAAITLALIVLLLVTYLPTMYAAFSERERQVSLLGSRAGTPATGIGLLELHARVDGLQRLEPLWATWEDWFARVHESHTSQPALAFFRSQRSDRSWIVAAGALLDGASLYVSCIDHEALVGVAGYEGGIRAPQAELCIRAGYLCLREIAQYFRVPFDTDPRPDDPITIDRSEFDEAWDRLARAGAPLVDDRDGAWTAFAGWRVNYDTPLLALADLVAAPEAPWTSDRSPNLARSRRRIVSLRRAGV